MRRAPRGASSVNAGAAQHSSEPFPATRARRILVGVRADDDRFHDLRGTREIGSWHNRRCQRPRQRDWHAAGTRFNVKLHDVQRASAFRTPNSAFRILNRPFRHLGSSVFMSVTTKALVSSSGCAVAHRTGCDTPRISIDARSRTSAPFDPCGQSERGLRAAVPHVDALDRAYRPRVRFPSRVSTATRNVPGTPATPSFANATHEARARRRAFAARSRRDARDSRFDDAAYRARRAGSRSSAAGCRPRSRATSSFRRGRARGAADARSRRDLPRRSSSPGGPCGIGGGSRPP